MKQPASPTTRPRQPAQRQQTAETPQPAKAGFGQIRIRAVAGATALKPKPAAKTDETTRDLPPLLRRDQFYD